MEAGLGIIVAALIGAAPESARKLVWIPLADDLPRTTVGLLTRTNSFLLLPAKRFAELLAESVPAFPSSREQAFWPKPPSIS